MSINFANRTIWTADCLDILRGMNSDCVDLVYLDPPFNSNHNYSAPIGSQSAGAAFKDTWSLDDVDAEWVNLIEAKHPALHRALLAAQSDSDKSYLVYMAARMLEVHRVLKPTGSVYLHCDPTMSHYLKVVMDAIFGRKNFRNEIIWAYTGPGSPKMRQFNRKHDTILWFNAGGSGLSIATLCGYLIRDSTRIDAVPRLPLHSLLANETAILRKAKYPRRGGRIFPLSDASRRNGKAILPKNR